MMTEKHRRWVTTESISRKKENEGGRKYSVVEIDEKKATDRFFRKLSLFSISSLLWLEAIGSRDKMFANFSVSEACSESGSDWTSKQARRDRLCDGCHWLIPMHMRTTEGRKKGKQDNLMEGSSPRMNMQVLEQASLTIVTVVRLSVCLSSSGLINAMRCPPRKETFATQERSKSSGDPKEFMKLKWHLPAN